MGEFHVRIVSPVSVPPPCDNLRQWLVKNNLFTVGAEMESAGMFVYYPPLWAVLIIRDGLLF